MAIASFSLKLHFLLIDFQCYPIGIDSFFYFILVMYIFIPAVVSSKTCVFIINIKINIVGYTKFVFIVSMLILSDAIIMNIKMEVSGCSNLLKKSGTSNVRT